MTEEVKAPRVQKIVLTIWDTPDGDDGNVQISMKFEPELLRDDFPNTPAMALLDTMMKAARPQEVEEIAKKNDRRPKAAQIIRMGGQVNGTGKREGPMTSAAKAHVAKVRAQRKERGK